MTLTSHILGYPRIGDKRQSKFALEKYWKGKASKADTQAALQAVFDDNIAEQLNAGLSVITTGDFAHYDLVLTQAVAFGVLPKRFAGAEKLDTFDRQFYFARGRDHTGQLADTAAWQMTKWFDTNYHYLVPELDKNQDFSNTDFSQIFKQVADAKAIIAKRGAQNPLKVVLVGPLSFLYLSSIKTNEQAHSAGCGCGHGASADVSANDDDKLALLDKILPVYADLLAQLGEQGVEWVQLDEPILSLDLPNHWQQAFERAYNGLQRTPPKLIVASYFDTLGNNCNVAVNLPVSGIHIDITRAKSPKQYAAQVIDQLPTHKILSIGVVDGRSVWTTDQVAASDVLTAAYERLGERLWVGSGSSLLHLPVDLAHETLPSALHGKLAFAKQKLSEVALCARLATGEIAPDDTASQIKLTPLADTAKVRAGEFAERYAKQNERLNLPLLPTTTIGSFPQTDQIRKARSDWNKGVIDDAAYERAMKAEIQKAVDEQEKLGIDVLVHGEAERTDMVEYFAKYMDGFWLSANGWVQSYGTRCVRPPIVVGDISRPKAMTVDWTVYAQSLTDKPMKGMLTGPVTILNWSFAPSDAASRDVLRLQIAEAINQEVSDLQDAGIAIVQIDEPAFREGLPLKTADQAHYWQQAVAAFKHSCSIAHKDTQIHTHMCYSSFHDCLAHISAMDADVITIETARSGLQLLDAFKGNGYHNAIGPGVYDIHSPRTPSANDMQVVIDEAVKYVPVERLWINPDCGLKTRGWEETIAALANMVSMTKAVRQLYS
ncbi:5-methyltetrahydropteroyltriglutamate--homocysteine S-methyltransferase [Moraxella caviae]|uniref:5-methyltetrahydropteroyltriglutamate--homocysteine S-methyltransferase n=1 Tax=Moraxella caviae TaxID=34060 RepID=A0A1T0ACI0_9GAMM|nr:5-methyltetrahydropteroyltriglutamate--homocysteine S-methyltransferase [Moraxella caviae]OOR93435.1 5-methyltetrahydropteroyltriglutamate--homocysteine S-methyltransferase [Moraxella caviae]STZ14094.1 5-methyltetrahydropteroyltriglutamate--homocysteine methyltransferase [Moraxella caviae]